MNSSGQDSGRVVIWNFDTVLNEEAEFDENIPKMLCQIDGHLGTSGVELLDTPLLFVH